MSAAFKNAEDVFKYLDSFHNMERGIPARTFRLDRVEALAELAGSPQRFCPVVHAAGSKGKGSTCAMIAAILTEAGYRTGLYVSPHVEDFRERIALSGEFFPDASYAAAGELLREAVARIGPAGLPGGEDPTFFELCTVLGFLTFKLEKCDAAVIETGLGGRLDATNIVDPIAAVLTPIELEHTEYLGSTIPLIAAEKAGIIKRGRPVFVSEQPPEALEVFRRVAAEKDAPLFYLPDHLEELSAEAGRDGTSMRAVFGDRSRPADRARARHPSGPAARFPRPLVAKLGLVGEIQAKNAALAALCVRAMYPEIDDETIARGLGKARMPARFERALESPPLILDGAHTPRSVSFAAESFGAAYGKGGVLLFSCAAGKDVESMARILAPHFSAVFLTMPGLRRAADADSLRRAFPAEARWIENTAEALEAALAHAKERDLPVLAIGSFYLAAEIKGILKARA